MYLTTVTEIVTKAKKAWIAFLDKMHHMLRIENIEGYSLKLLTLSWTSFLKSSEFFKEKKSNIYVMLKNF